MMGQGRARAIGGALIATVAAVALTSEAATDTRSGWRTPRSVEMAQEGVSTGTDLRSELRLDDRLNPDEYRLAPYVGRESLTTAEQSEERDKARLAEELRAKTEAERRKSARTTSEGITITPGRSKKDTFFLR